MSVYFTTVFSFLFLLLFAGGMFLFAKKFRFPYTITLVASGILLAILVKILPTFGFLTTFQLTPETLFYVFLPILLFESAYNIKYRELMQHIRAISGLAVISLMISAFVIAGILYCILGFFGINMPFLFLLLFGTLISATDPVSVLALFKEIGAPRRLTLIFEGESLLNDGTALSLFLVILALIVPGISEHENLFAHMISGFSSSFGTLFPLFSGFISFLSMILTGIAFGGLLGLGASRLIPLIRTSKLLEITFTIVIAHATFLLAEWINHVIIPVSAVIATTIVAIVMGNYGRYKLSVETRHMMGEYWEFFAFIANSLVFLLVGIMIVGLDINYKELIVTMILTILVVIIARAISIYTVLIPLNLSKKEYTVPYSWMHLLSWGSLRGALAVIMVFLIPEDLTLPEWNLETSPYDFILAITVGCIIFTTFIKATTITGVIKKLKIANLSPIEDVDFNQGEILFLTKTLHRIEDICTRGFLTTKQKELMTKGIQAELASLTQAFGHLEEKYPKESEILLSRSLALHAIEIEKSLLTNLFNHDEIPEWIFRRMLVKLDSQMERIEEGKTQIKEAYEHKITQTALASIVDAVVLAFSKKRDADEERYIKARTRIIIIDKLLERLEIFDSIENISGSNALKNLRTLYAELLKQARTVQSELIQKKSIQKLEGDIVSHMIQTRKEDILNGFVSSGIITPKFGKIIEEKHIHS